MLLLYYSVAARTTVSAADASSVSAAPACAAAAVGMSNRCQVKMGIPNFGDLGS